MFEIFVAWGMKEKRCRWEAVHAACARPPRTHPCLSSRRHKTNQQFLFLLLALAGVGIPA